jgi:hypothetical protein
MPRLLSPRTWCQPKWCHIGVSDNPFRVAQQAVGTWRHFMMTRMPEMSRRAVLRLGSGVAAGALGAYAMDRLLAVSPSAAQPVVMTGTGVRLAPPPPLEPPLAPTMVNG